MHQIFSYVAIYDIENQRWIVIAIIGSILTAIMNIILNSLATLIMGGFFHIHDSCYNTVYAMFMKHKEIELDHRLLEDI